MSKSANTKTKKSPFSRKQEAFIDQRIKRLTKPWYMRKDFWIAGILFLATLMLSRFSNSPVLTNFLHEILLTEKAVTNNIDHRGSSLRNGITDIVSQEIGRATQDFRAKPITAYHWKDRLGEYPVPVSTTEQCREIYQSGPDNLFDQNCYKLVSNSIIEVEFFANKGDKVRIHFSFTQSLPSGDIVNPDSETLRKLSIEIDGDCVGVRSQDNVCRRPFQSNRRYHAIDANMPISMDGLHTLEISIEDATDLAPNTLLVTAVVLVEYENIPES